MPIDAGELRRLHEAAVRQGMFPEYYRYLHDHYDEILSALEDLDRLYAAMIQACRNAGGFAQEGVSVDFLCMVPDEVKALKQELDAARGAK